MRKKEGSSGKAERWARLLVIALTLTWIAGPTAFGLPAAEGADLTLAQLIEGFNKATLGSVADAVDQATGQRGFMVHDMRPLF